MARQFPQVNCQHGAPMGRDDTMSYDAIIRHAVEDGHGCTIRATRLHFPSILAVK